jgi:hypothetical protein
MEFFRVVKAKTTEQLIQKHLIPENLENISNELFGLSAPEENALKVGGIWGEFTLSKSRIKGGVRFALVECPNALCWTITTGYPPDRDSIVIHLTINRQRKRPEFIDEIHEFLNDHCSMLEKFFSGLQEKVK